MLNAIVRVSLQFRFLVLVAAATLILLSIFRLGNLPVDALPEFSAPVIEIQTEALGLSATEVEELITLNLEEILASVSWLKSISSKSITGLSSVILIFEPGTDLMQARQLVQERLNLAHALPNVSKPPVMLQPVSTTNRAMMIGLSPKEVSLIDASVLARWTIMPKLMSVPGVANVSVWGQRARQLQVQVDPQRLRDRGVSLNQVIKSTGDALWVSSLSYLEASTPGAGGWIDTPNQRLGIQHVQPITSPGELATVAIPSTSLRLGDIANVVEDHPPLIGDAIIEDAPGLLLVIEKFANASAVEVVKGVDAALDELRPGLSGIEIHSSAFRATSFIELAVGNLRLVLLAAGGLLLLITAAWFKSWRAALVSLATLTLTMLLAAFATYLLGATINAMGLAGLVTGLVAVAGATVVELQEFVRRAERERASDGNLSAILEETPARERRSPALYMTLILLLATAPLFLMHGAWGAFVRPFAISFLLTLFAAMVVALTASPVLATMLLGRRSRPEGSLARWLQKRYEAALAPLVRAPRYAYVIAGALLLAGLIILPLLRWSMIPLFKERDVRVTWEAAPGTSLPEMRRMMVQANQELRRNPGVREVTAHIGRAVTGDQVVGIESGQIWISMTPQADYDATLSTIRETVQGYPGISGKVENYLTARLRSLLGGFSTDEPLIVRVQGPERDVLQQEAARVAQILSNTPGLSNLRVEGQTETPQVEVKVNLTAAGLAGIKPGDVRRAAATIFAGLEVGSLFEKQKVFEVVVWGTPETRQSLTAVHDLLIDTPEDTHVRLADVAEVRVIPTQQVIKREGVSRYLDIRAKVAGRNLPAVTREVKARLQKVSFPLEYHSVVLGDYADREAAYRRVLLAALAAAIGVYLLFQACFQSWRLASLLYLSALVALMGGIIATFAAGGTATLGSTFGGLAVLGTAVRHGILLVNGYQQLQREDCESVRPELVLRAASGHFRAFAMSATVTAAILIPILVLGPGAGLELLHPMAVFMVGGLFVATLFNLLAFPAFYLLLAPSQLPIEVESEPAYESHQNA